MGVANETVSAEEYWKEQLAEADGEFLPEKDSREDSPSEKCITQELNPVTFSDCNQHFRLGI